MSNLTIAVDEDVIRRARVRAIQDGTSVSAQVRAFLAAYAAGQTAPAVAAPAPAEVAAAKVSEARPPAYLARRVDSSADAQSAASTGPSTASTAIAERKAPTPQPEWLQQIRARVEAFGGIEPAEWLQPRAKDSGRDDAGLGL